MVKKNIIYNISGNFYNDFEYPFNINNRDGDFIEDFGREISSVAELLSNDKSEHKIRFMWIAAEGYCQTEVFLKKILSKFDYPVLYLHWLDYSDSPEINEKNPIGKIICNVTTEDSQYFSSLENIKICVIDHAEEIRNINSFYELCNPNSEYCLNNFIFIFISKNQKGTYVGENFWNKLTLHMGDKENINISRSHKYFYIVKRYSTDMCEKIFEKAIINKEVREKCCRISNTIVSDMRRVLYLDLIIKFINKYSAEDEVPDSFDNETFINEVYKNASEGFVQTHIKSCNSLEDFIQKYYESDFVKNFHFGEQQRVPLDNYIWACGFVHYTHEDSSYQRNIDLLFSYFKKNINTKSFDIIFEISKQVINCALEDISSKFSVAKYLYALLNYNLMGARFCAETLNEIYLKLSKPIVIEIFEAICKRYNKNLINETEINIFRQLGLQIGRLLPKIDNKVVEKSLSCFFSEIKDDYICPQCNQNGISVIPVTNFEFEKFVKDNGYENYYSKENNEQLNTVALQYYRDLLEYILSSLNGHNLKDSRCLASILKGYDWLQYKRIAYLMHCHNNFGNDTEIYSHIENKNYNHPLRHPAKWSNETNDDTMKAFCNPLQPVVCVNIFEARAYAKWLSDKIKKDVRIVKYDPDYISIIGMQNDGINNSQRVSFLKYLKDKENYINIVENSKFFYGEDFIENKEPSPIAIPNSLFSGIYDFLGNVFETQDTLYTYNYDADVSEETKNIFKQRQETLVDYNCPGGGLQRTKANLPPEYMGQVPAFLRNQDIGFRLVISGKSEIGEERKASASISIEYDESELNCFSRTINEVASSSLLEDISVRRYDTVLSAMSEKIKKHAVFSDGSHSILLLSQDDSESEKEYLLLKSDGDNIYAYYLNYITSVKYSDLNSEMFIVSRKPKIPNILALRKKCKNKDFADWIDLVAIKKNDYYEVYSAQTVNISNGFFAISEHKVNSIVLNASVHKRDASLIGRFKIVPNENFKKHYYDSLKLRLGTEFFLPDWIDIVDYIDYISKTIPFSSNLDSDTIMTAITTIDTSHLHEQINNKKLIEIEKNRTIE